jgi:hypothetical protein
VNPYAGLAVSWTIVAHSLLAALALLNVGVALSYQAWSPALLGTWAFLFAAALFALAQSERLDRKAERLVHPEATP